MSVAGRPRYELKGAPCVLVIYQNKKCQSESKETVMQMVKVCFRPCRVDSSRVYCDLKCDEVKKIMQNVREENYGRYSCLIVIVIGPGGKNNTVRAQDGCYSLRNDIVENVTSNRTLDGKPKIFIVNFTEQTSDLAKPGAKGGALSSNKVDTIIFQSEYDGPSLREGFVPKFFDMVYLAAEYSTDEVSMLLNKRAKDARQTLAMRTTLRKQLVLSDLAVASNTRKRKSGS